MMPNKIEASISSTNASSGQAAQFKSASLNSSGNVSATDSQTSAIIPAVIGKQITAQVVSVQPSQITEAHSASSAALTQPVLQDLIYSVSKHHSLTSADIRQFSAPISIENTTNNPSQILNNLIKSFNITVKIQDQLYVFTSELPLPSGEQIMLKKISSSSWSWQFDNKTAQLANLFMPFFISKSNPQRHWSDIAWQLLQASVTDKTLKPTNLPNSTNITENPAPNLLQKQLAKFFNGFLSLNDLHHMSAPQMANSIKNQLQDSGLFLENNLAKFALVTNSEQKNLVQAWQKTAYSIQTGNFLRDHKAALAELFNSFNEFIKDSDATSEMAPLGLNASAIKLLQSLLQAPLPSSNKLNSSAELPIWQDFFYLNQSAKLDNPSPFVDQINPESALNQLLEQLMGNIKQQINRSHIHQLQSLMSSQQQDSYSFFFEIPLLTQNQAVHVPIWIEGKKSSAQESNPKKMRQWRALLVFELPSLGRIVADCYLTENLMPTELDEPKQIQIQFFTETQQATESINQKTQQLNHTLSELGFNVSTPECRCPLPVLGDQRFQNSYTHIET